MLKFFFRFFGLSLLLAGNTAFAAQDETMVDPSYTVAEPAGMSSISWMTNFDQAMQEAQQSQKPLLVLFTGSDWCTWCKRLEGEILNKPEFAQTVANKFIFVKLDVPLYKQTDPGQRDAINKLKSQYGVEGVPMIVIVNPNGQKLGQMGYQSTTPQGYGQQLLKMTQR